MKNNLILTLYKNSHSVFTLKDISFLAPEINYNNLKSRMSYAVKLGELKKLRRGIYAKANYNPLEVSNILFTPSYISLETVLRQAGLTFQHYDRIFAMSYMSRTIRIDQQTYEYRRLPKEVLMNKKGIRDEKGVVMASPERAFLDALYIYNHYGFDNVDPLNWELVYELSSIYGSKVLVKRVDEHYKIYTSKHVT